MKKKLADCTLRELDVMCNNQPDCDNCPCLIKDKYNKPICARGLAMNIPITKAEQIEVEVESPFTEVYKKHLRQEELQVARKLKASGYKYIRRVGEKGKEGIYANRDGKEIKLKNQDLFQWVKKYIPIDEILKKGGITK